VVGEWGRGTVECGPLGARQEEQLSSWLFPMEKLRASTVCLADSVCRDCIFELTLGATWPRVCRRARHTLCLAAELAQRAASGQWLVASG